MAAWASSLGALRGPAARAAASRPGAAAAAAASAGLWASQAHRTLATLRVAGVPEHFNAPFLTAEKRGLYKERGIDFQWKCTPEGTGKMSDMLLAGEVDVAVLVSEGAVAKVASGSPFKIVGTYVQSPLRLGVHVKRGSPYTSVGDLKGKVFGVSRMGSNSHLMSYVLGHQQGWTPSEDVPLKIVQTLKGAQEAMSKGEIDAWVWERFTTKHLVDSGEWSLLSELHSPWHPFLVVASEKAIAERADEIRAMIETTRPVCEEFKANRGESTYAYLAEHHGMSREDAEDWLGSTQWACASEAAAGTLTKTQDALVSIGVLQTRITELESMLAPGLCTLA